MSDVFFRQLESPEPDFHLGVGSDTHARQTARVIIAFEEVLEAERPRPGDRGGGRELHARVRAGGGQAPRPPRSRGGGPPELRPSHAGGDQPRPHRPPGRPPLRHRAERGRKPTTHRPSNVDTQEVLLRWLPALERQAETRPVVFPCHVRTRERLVACALKARLEGLPAFHLLEPLGYLEFLRLMEEAAVVVTDSGGIQEETTFLGVPCLTRRETTERPVTVELGTNRLVPLEPEAIAAAIGSILDGDRPPGKRPPLWDGRAAERIVEVLGAAHLAGPHAARAQLPASNHARAGPSQP